MNCYRYVLPLILLALSYPVIAQEEYGEEDENEIQFNQGIFLTFEDFRKNTPIPEEFIVTGLNPRERNFYFNLLKEEKVNIKSMDSSYVVKPARIWGYFDGRALYISRNVFPEFFVARKDVSDHLWAPVMQIGKICLIYYNKNFKPELSLLTVGHGPSKQNKTALFLMDTKDGSFYKANTGNLEDLIRDDLELHNEFKNYKGDNEERLYIFLKKYNEKHKLETSLN